MRSRGKISLSLLQVFCGVRFCLVSMLMVWRRPNAFLSPMEHEAKRKFCATRVKGGNPLRVQGGARESLPSGNSAVRRTPNPTKQAKRLALYRRRAHPEPNKSKTQVLRYSGQGRKSLAGAGRSPRILAVRQSRRQAYSEPNQASQTACALAARRLLPLYSIRLHA